MRALAADPRNPVALKNLGAIFGQEGDSLQALYHLRQSNECDPQDLQTVYGLAFAYMELGDIEQAQKHFQMVLETAAPEDLRGLARNGLRGEMRSGDSSPEGLGWMRSSICRMRCGYSAGSRWKRSGRSFEIGMIGRHGTGWISTTPSRAMSCERCRRGVFSALELVCIMYAGFKRIEPGMDGGVGLGEEWGMAERLGMEMP